MYLTRQVKRPNVEHVNRIVSSTLYNHSDFRIGLSSAQLIQRCGDFLQRILDDRRDHLLWTLSQQLDGCEVRHLQGAPTCLGRRSALKQIFDFRFHLFSLGLLINFDQTFQNLDHVGVNQFLQNRDLFFVHQTLFTQFPHNSIHRLARRFGCVH